jgi:proteasome lid subunit RPN8/RPN11
MIAIPGDVLAAVVRHARAAFPAECCGYLTGPRDGTAVDTAVACSNTAPNNAEFAIDGVELLAFARSFDGDHPARIVYHSHPNGRAYFSALDRKLAQQAGYPVHHLVVGVTAAGATEAALFADDGTNFVEIARWPGQVLG